jgi:hypothetical protein
MRPKIAKFSDKSLKILSSDRQMRDAAAATVLPFVFVRSTHAI